MRFNLQNTAICDIKMRQILNVKTYVTTDKDKFFEKHNINNNYDYQSFSNITFFHMNNKEVCTEFSINTDYGDFTIPVLGMKHLQFKKKIKNDLLNYLPDFEKKIKHKYYLILIKFTNLPIEMIEHIIYYF